MSRTVDHFVAPSRFLRERLVEWGLPRERTSHVPTPVDAAAFRAPPARRAAREDGPLRVAFIGTLVPVKGAHVLLDAWERLDDDDRARARLWIHGPRSHDPRYQRELSRRAAELGVELTGSLERSEVPRALAATDLLVVPSVWFENRPLIVLEALAMHTPLLVSEPGGMAELVEEGVSGWRFPMGDAAALALRLQALIRDREPLFALYPRPIALPTWDDLVAQTSVLYERLLEEKRRATTHP